MTSLYRLAGRVVDQDVATETFAPSEHLASPWDPRMQHGGPVAALLTRAIDRCAPAPGTRIARLSVELLGAVPMTEVRVRARVARPGRRIAMLTASLDARDAAGDWRPAALATAWRLATQPTQDVVTAADPAKARPDGDSATLHDYELPESWRVGGFVEAITWRVERIGTTPTDHSTAWASLDLPLVDGEATTALERVVAIADTANGIGARLDPADFTFLNCDLTVQLFAPPTGRWFGLEAETSVGPDGVGLSAAVIHAQDGPIGRVSQTVLVERRRPR